MPVQLLRKRYLAIKVAGEEVVSKSEVESAIHALASEGRVNPTLLRLINYNPKTGLGVVRCSHRSVNDMKLGLTAVTEIAGKHARVRTLGVSGTIRALRRKFIPRDASPPRAAHPNA